MIRKATLVVCTLVLALSAGFAAAATVPGPDTLKVDYFANANTAGAPDGTVRLTNPGTIEAVSKTGGYGNTNICAAIFVFDPQQELSECCSCFLSPDGLRTLSVDVDVTGNPLTGVVLTTGLIKVVSTPTVSNTCPLPTSLNPTPAIRAWATHIQNSNFAITETASQDATLSSAEVSRLQGECYAINLDGSGKGICTCGTGD
ncbi:MAG: hypothetical protein ABSF59_07860 [Candidatus Sulfotelmatobacter sp.]|jgi:hypothetical protein